MKTLAVLVILLCTAIGIVAQDNNKENKRFRLSSAEISFSQQIGNPNLLNASDFRQLYGDVLPEITPDNGSFYPLFVPDGQSPQFFVSNGQFSTRYWSRLGGRFYQSQVLINANISFNINKKNGVVFKGKPTLRLGLSYWNNSGANVYSTESNRFAYDTIYSAGQISPVDSVYTRQLSQDMRSNRLRLNACLLWRTNEFERFTFYGGFGIGAGISLKSKLNYGLYETSRLEPWPTGQETESYLISAGERNGAMIFDLHFQTVLGTELRLGAKNNFLRKSNLFVEYTPSIFMTKTGDLPIRWNFGSMTTFGLRYKF